MVEPKAADAHEDPSSSAAATTASASASATTSTAGTEWPTEEDDDDAAGVNGSGFAGETSAQGLRQELERTRKQRDEFEAQYKGLLGKLTQMRSTLGERLRQDAEELEAKDAQIDTLTSETERLTTTVDTLKAELNDSNSEAEKLTAELKELRASSQAAQEESAARQQIAALERRLREAMDQSEKLRIDVETWEGNCMTERATREELEEKLRTTEAARDSAEDQARVARDAADREAQTARELQSVLEEFQATQDNELQRALGDYQEKYDRTAEALEEHKLRARKAETKLQEFQSAAERSQSLEKEVKEKNLLIGKLRHEAVILNEHLTEALRRLRNDGSDATVDRKLLTNLLLQFLTTPRADAKRFEMLSLIASVLHWSDEERETAGLQRQDVVAGRGAAPGVRTPGSGRRLGTGVESAGGSSARGHGRTKPLDGSTAGNEESFSNLFVEFLLSEADKAKQDDGPQSPSATFASAPSASPLGSPSPGGAAGSTKRPSFNLDALANLQRGSVQSPGASDGSDAKGKGKA